MKTCTALLISLYILTQPTQAATVDSLIINFANRTKIIIHAPDKKGIQLLSQYDLNRIVRDMGLRLDSVPAGKTYLINEHNGQRYLTDTTLIIRHKDGSVRIEINTNRELSYDTAKTTERRYQRTIGHSRTNDSKIKTDFMLGLNTWIPQAASLPGNQGVAPDLKPLGSRYFAINIYRNPTLIKGRKARISIRYGLELAWNNYMFEENIRAQKGTDQILFSPVVESLKKSKLTVATIQLPIMPQVNFYNADGRKTFHIGLGGFIGYRIDSYTKVKYQNNDKNRDHTNYYLNDLQYGVATNIGLLKTDFFVKYNLNSVFRSNQGPDMHTISFGISL